MRDFRRLDRVLAAAGFACALVAAMPAHARDLRAGLPPIVFVRRTAPAGAEAGQVPGLGPHGTFVAGSGSLLERAPDGRVRALLAPGRLLDVADPASSPDGARVAFSGLERAGARWRIWLVDRAGGEPRCATCGEPGEEIPADDADPFWWGDTLVFASTRAGGRALYDGSAITQLWLLPPGGRAVQITHEANGALDPCADPRSRRLVFARWWFNPWVSSAAGGVTRSPSLALGSQSRPGRSSDVVSASIDSVNLWQVVSADLVRDARGKPAIANLRLAAGGTLPRRGGMGLQPATARTGDVLAVAARNTGLAPRPGTLSLQRFGAPPSPGRRIAGAAIGDGAGDPYTEGTNLAAPAACAPAALPDGRVVYALDPGGRGDFGLWIVSADGRSREPLLDDAGTLELDPAIVAASPRRRAGGAGKNPARSAGSARSASARAVTSAETTRTFRYLSTDVFAGIGAPARRTGARLNVYRLVDADSAELLRQVGVPRGGRIDLHLPADTPLFEQLTDGAGHALMSAHGPAQVRGFNAGAPGTTARCQGCHLGHSAATTR